MGNRANIVFVDKSEERVSPNIYLHWNGGPESVYPFLDELDRRNVRADQDYECARFIHIVGEYMDQDNIHSLSLGVVNGPENITIDALNKVPTDNGDNGFYIVCREVKPYTVRRFLCDYEAKNEKGENTYPVVERDKKWVNKERKEAYKHGYNVHKKGQETIAEFFKRSTGKKKMPECD